MSPPRLVVLGANLESEIGLTALLECGASIHGLLTLSPEASTGMSDYRDLRAIATRSGISVILTGDPNAPEALGALRRLAPDYVLILGWTQICGAEFLAIPARMTIGTHPSRLPRGRGRAPLPWAIIQGDTEGAVSFFEATSRADAGAILHQQRFIIPHGADATQLYQLAAIHLGRGACEVYSQLCAGTLTGLPQDEAGASYRAKRVAADGWIDFFRPAEEIERLVRAVTRPYPGAYSYYHDRKITFWRAALLPHLPYCGTPGQIVLRRDGRLYVQAGDQPLWLWDAESKGATLSVRDFRTGERLGYRLEDELHALKQMVRDLMDRRQ